MLTQDLESIDKRLTNQTAPDNSRRFPRNPPRPGGERELIAPAQIGIAR